MSATPTYDRSAQRQGDVLARLFAFYDALDAAAAIGDGEQVAWLVEARAEVVDELVAAAAEAPLTSAVKAEIADCERRLHLTLVRLHDAIFQALSAQRQRAHALSRYTTH